ncbi:PASTA domain-containing protein, partial [Streptosporangium algeriense]
TIAVLAVAGVACAGLVGVAINAMAAGETGPGKDSQGMVVPTETAPTTKPPSTRRTRTAAPPVKPTQDDEPKSTPTPTPTPTETDSGEPEEEPTGKPTGEETNEPKPTPSPSKSPSATATPVVKKKVPSVMYLSPEAAKETLKKAGFKVATSVGPDVDITQCTKVVEQRPGAGTMWDTKRPVDITLVNDTCPPSPTPAPSTS